MKTYSIKLDNYYFNQLTKVKPEMSQYPPTIKVFANGNGEDTNHFSINAECAQALILWLANNFLNANQLNEVLTEFNKQSF